jgi:hypothetical protein
VDAGVDEVLVPPVAVSPGGEDGVARGPSPSLSGEPEQAVVARRRVSRAAKPCR